MRTSPLLTCVLLLAATAPLLAQAGPPTGGQLATPLRLRPLSVPTSAQAGQLLVVQAPLGVLLQGTIEGVELTSGTPQAFEAVSGLELDPAAGTLTLRVPAREVGSLRLVFLRPGPTPPAVHREVHTVQVTPPNLFDGIRVDGTFDVFEDALIAGHDTSQSATVTMIDASTGAPVGTVALDYSITTDIERIYLRVRFEDATEDRLFDLNTDPEPQRIDMLSLRFDDNQDGLFGAGDDERIVLPFLTGSGYIDGTSDPSATDDLTVDGVARMAYGAGAWTAEFLLPRTTDAAGQDPDLSPGATVPFQLLLADGFGSAATAPRIGSLFPGVTGTTTTWQPLPLPAPLAAEYAPKQMPSTGHFFVISDEAQPLGELFEVDLASGTLVQRTFNNRYEDWVSVAPSGAFAVYGSAPALLSFGSFELYKWEAISGSELPLTLNGVLDGHPAVSPDGQSLALARFLVAAADIYTMQVDGSGEKQVTSDPTEENDPEWTKDGRLVIKTSLWTGQEQLATIDTSGTLLQRLTDNAYSDHDPFVTADNEWVLFERFEGTGSWAADWNVTQSTPWPVLAVRLDGSEERLLVSDGLVNWLPVAGPSGPDQGLIVYFKSTAFNGRELRVIDRFGVDHGRFLPDKSRIRYMDWK